MGSKNTINIGTATGQNHFATCEEQAGANGVAQSYGDGGKLLLVVGGVWQDATDDMKIEGKRGTGYFGRAYEVVNRGLGFDSIFCHVWISFFVVIIGFNVLNHEIFNFVLWLQMAILAFAH